MAASCPLCAEESYTREGDDSPYRNVRTKRTKRTKSAPASIPRWFFPQLSIHRVNPASAKHSDWGIADQRVAGRPPVGWLLWSIAPNDMSCSSAASMRLLLRWPWKRALICVLDNRWGMRCGARDQRHCRTRPATGGEWRRDGPRCAGPGCAWPTQRRRRVQLR